MSRLEGSLVVVRRFGWSAEEPVCQDTYLPQLWCVVCGVWWHVIASRRASDPSHATQFPCDQDLD